FPDADHFFPAGKLTGAARTGHAVRALRPAVSRAGRRRPDLRGRNASARRAVPARPHTMDITFLGATDTVTRSPFLVRHGKASVLVDCGLFQGLKKLRERNWDPFPVAPNSIDAVVLTHAHVDHSGYLPLLARRGFRGPVYCTRATADLCNILLPDAAHLQEEEAAFANKHGYSRHRPALPLYTRKDASAALRLLEPVDFNEIFEIVPGVRAGLTPAGHILGAACAFLEWDGRRL